MKAFSLRTFTLSWAAMLAALILTGCGGDNNPISPGNAQITQLSTVNSQVPQNVFSSTLTGAQEVPSVTSNGSGTGVVSVDPATNQMRATIVTADINGTQAHIHLGATSVAGPIVFSLTENQAGSGVWTTTATLTTDQLNQLTAGNYYFNVHTAAYPDGEIRGQILAQLPPSGAVVNTTINSAVPVASGSSSSAVTVSSASATAVTASANANRVIYFTNVMSGSLVVPPNASTATATGLAAYHSNNRILTAVVVSRELAGTGANIRQAAAGAVGPLVGSFTETSPGSGIWVLRTVLTATQATALNNGGMYYELLSSTFPAGELRGQIVSTEGTTAPATSLTPAVPATPTTTTTPANSAATTTAPTVTTPTVTTPTVTTPTVTPPTATTTPTTSITTPITNTTTPTTTTPTVTATTPASTITTPPTTTTVIPSTTTTPTTPTITTPALTPSTTVTPAASNAISAAPTSGTTTTSRTISTTSSTTTPIEAAAPVAVTTSTGNTDMSSLSTAAQ